MEKPTALLLLCLITAFPTAHGDDNGVAQFFVFGDSYVDTGNTKPGTICWKEPYGTTVGSPSGRFSDGFVLSDYFATFFGVVVPVPYNKDKTNTKLDKGVNFAFGGTGVFDTLVDEPNMTTQIDFFQQLLDQQKPNLDSAVALLSVSGDDYTTFVQKNIGNINDWPKFSDSVVKQIGSNILRLQGLGVKKIVVTSMGPIGCYPIFSFLTGYTGCAELFNIISKYHNRLLTQTVADIDTPGVISLDMFGAFMKAFNEQPFQGVPLKACCDGALFKDTCGTIDESGAKKYTVCEHPVDQFFWDRQHPTQHGWLTIFRALELKSSLAQLII